MEGVVAVCNVEEVRTVLVLLVDTAADKTDVVDGCLVDLTERWIDCLLLLLAIDEAEEEVVALLFVVVLVADDDAAVGVVLDILCILSTAISLLSQLFDLYCRVDLLDCLVVATISVDVMAL